MSIFISAAPKDRFFADALASALRHLGETVSTSTAEEFQSDPMAWERAISRADIVIILVTEDGLAASQSLHVQILTEQGTSGPKPAQPLPVLLRGASRPPRTDTPYILSRVPWLDAASTVDPDELAALVMHRIGDARAPSRASDEQATRPPNPYRGLAPFEEENSGDFFGREALADSLSSDLANAALGSGSGLRLLAVVGPSGVGKSSLARAGIVPQLLSKLSSHGVNALSVTMKPGARPLEALALSVSRVSGRTDIDHLNGLVEALSNNDRTLHLSIRLARPDDYLVLVVDQFEEIYTLTASESDRLSFVRNLLNAATHPDGHLIVLFTLRSDFYSECAFDPQLAFYIASRQLLVAPMEPAELRDAIEKPATTRGVRFEPGLVDRLISDVKHSPGALPLLQFALMQLWARKSTGRVLMHDDYDAIGGVGGALAQRADELYRGLNDADRALFRVLMLRLVRPGDRTEDTRRRVGYSELEFGQTSRSNITRMVRLLASAHARLIMVSEEAGEPTVEITHEALLTEWPLLRQWINEERESLIYGRTITAASQAWLADGEDTHLLRGPALERALEWDVAHAGELNLRERDFIVASLTSELQDCLLGPLAPMRDRIESYRRIGPRLHAAVVRLQDKSHDELIARRALFLLGPQRPAEEESLLDALDLVEAAEYPLVVEALSLRNSAELIQELWARIAAARTSSEHLRRLLAAAQLSSDDVRWPDYAEELAQHLSSLDVSGRLQWTSFAVPVAVYLHRKLANLVEGGPTTEPPASREGALDVLLKLAPVDPALMAEILARADDDLLKAAVDIGDKLDEFSDPADVQLALLSMVPKPPNPPAEPTRSGAVAALASMGISTLDRFDPDPLELYGLARRLWLREVPKSQLLDMLEESQTPYGRAAVLLALSRHRLGEGVEQSEVLRIFGSDPNALVHSAAGLCIRASYGRDLLGQLEHDLHSAELVPGRDWWVTLATGEALTFNVIRSGSFVMGSPSGEAGRSSAEIEHDVDITKDFFMADRVLLRGEYEPLVHRLGHKAFVQDLDEWSPTPEHPIVSQTWGEATRLCDELRSVTNLPGHFTLPTEAQWEYACRAGTKTAYHFGDDARYLDMHGWFLGNCPDRRARPPRLLWPNAWGVFDMHGGVYEWCRDFYGPYSPGHVSDPCGPDSGPGKVLRGGGYNYSAQDCRSAYRYFTQPDNRNARIGIRLIYEP